MTNLSLSKVLFLDALSCAAIFAVGVLATVPVAELLGLPQATIAAAGWICLAAAALLAFLSVRPIKALLTLAVAGNAAWVLASLAVWIGWFEQLSPIGHAVVLLQLVIVSLFAAVEARGLRNAGLSTARTA